MPEQNIPEQTNDDNRIISINIEEQMKSAYIDYSMSVIVGRALPDVRDGLKPVHRRVLFGMHELGVRATGAHKKSARIVGEVLGKYHPHGDTSVYDTMVRMAQEWSLRYMLVDGQGNFGSIDGDSPAAMRYTEARMRKIADDMLIDIDKDTVDHQLNFDDTLEEPKVLPTRIPNLLVNGASGIAVGMATNMPPHNLSEVVDGTIAYIENPNIEIDELITHIKAPDFPTGGVIIGKDIIKQESIQSLGELADVLVKKPEWKLQIAGHTDNVGNDQANLILSKKRAESVKAFMVSKGIDAGRLTALYFGETQPIADNGTPEGRQKNRRVEMTIVFE